MRDLSNEGRKTEKVSSMKTLLFSVALLLSGPVLADCTKYQVETTPVKVEIDTSKSIEEVDEMAGMHSLSFLHSKLLVKQQDCTYSLWYDTFTLYIPKEFSERACLRTNILRYQMAHIKLYEEALEEMLKISSTKGPMTTEELRKFVYEFRGWHELLEAREARGVSTSCSQAASVIRFNLSSKVSG